MSAVASNDIFISYAHADNGTVHGAAFGWVTMLAHNLNAGPNVLSKHIYIDHKLKAGDNFDTQLIDKVCASKLLVILLSQNYIDSDWCGKELERFVASHADDPDKPTDVFVVELVPYEALKNVPDAITRLRKRNIHAKFWLSPVDAASVILAGFPTPQGNGPEAEHLYWRVLRELQSSIDERLREWKAKRDVDGVENNYETTLINLSKPHIGTILLADVTDDLEALRNRLKFELEREGVILLPGDGDYVGLSPDEFHSGIADDLQRCDLFVQLLSRPAGRKVRGFEAPLAQLQFKSAEQAGTPIMQWCHEVPPNGSIPDLGHDKLFRTPFIRATTMTTFKSEVLKTITQINRDKGNPPPPAPRRTLFLDDFASESELKVRVRELLKRENCEIRGLPASASLGGNGLDIAELLKPCRAGITLYPDNSQYSTVYNRLVYFLNQVTLSELPVARWGVCMKGGTVADEFGIDSDDVVSLSEDELIMFIRGLWK